MEDPTQPDRLTLIFQFIISYLSALLITLIVLVPIVGFSQMALGMFLAWFFFPSGLLGYFGLRFELIEKHNLYIIATLFGYVLYLWLMIKGIATRQIKLLWIFVFFLILNIRGCINLYQWWG
jgi:hypothetical protein